MDACIQGEIISNAILPVNERLQRVGVFFIFELINVYFIVPGPIVGMVIEKNILNSNPCFNQVMGTYLISDCVIDKILTISRIVCENTIRDIVFR